MKKVLVTGSNGFVGNHLVNELVNNGYKVLGIGIDDNKLVLDNFEYKKVNLNNFEELSGINFKNIDYVIHLAGLASVGPSFDNPVLYLNTNIGIEANLFEACLRHNALPVFLVISSGSLYKPGQALPLKETSEIEASSPYAVSKIGQEELAKYYRKRGFKCIIARPFNHIGPGQGLGFITSDFAHQIINNIKDNQKELLVGNLDAKRDYTDVRDIVKGYRLLIEKGEDGQIYNLCSGKSFSAKTILNKLLEIAKEKFDIIQDSSKVRKVEVKDIYGSFQKIKNTTGWEPTIKLENSLVDILDYWKSIS